MSWATWRPPTARDATGTDHPVRCPQCRRPCAPDMVQPTADLPAAVRARLRRPAAAGACDACRATLHREGVVTAADWARFLGAPEAVAAVLEAKRAEPGAGRHAAALAASDARRGVVRGARA